MDYALVENSCASMAHLAVEARQPHDALRIVDEGLRRARCADGTGQLIARLLALRARGLALIGDRPASARALADAERTLDHNAGTTPAEWIAGCDHASLAGEAALCWAELTQLDEAERHTREVIRLRGGDRVRSRVFAQLTLADVMVRGGRTEEAASVGSAVCSSSGDLTSRRVERKLQVLGTRLSTRPRSAQVQGFLDDLATRGAHPEPAGTTITTWPI